MSDERQETIADVVAAMRDESHAGDGCFLEWVGDKMRSYAGRIEAAAKREREAGAEAAKICGEIGEMVGREAACHQPVTDCHGLNTAAMREACANIAEYAKTAACHTEDAHLLGYLNQIERWAEAALSAPPRNCDAFSKAQVLEMLEDRSFSKEDTIEWLFDEAKGETDGSK